MQDIEEIKQVLESNIRGEIRNREAAALIGMSLREFSRIKAHYRVTGVVNRKRGCKLPFNEEKSSVLFTELVNKRLDENMADVLKRVCDQTEKKYETIRKYKIYSYPSWSYCIPQLNQIIVPLKTDDVYFGGMMFDINECDDTYRITYVDFPIDERIMVDGRENENYIDLIRLIIEVMSKTYFQNVKNRTKEETEPIEKFRRYYKDFNNHIKECREEENMKNVLFELLGINNNNNNSSSSNNNNNNNDDEDNDNMDSLLTLSPSSSSSSDSYCSTELLSPLPLDDDENDNGNIDNVNTFKVVSDDCESDNYTFKVYLSPPPSPRFIRSRSTSRSRSPRRFDYNPPIDEVDELKEGIFSIYQNVAFSPI